MQAGIRKRSFTSRFIEEGMLTSEVPAYALLDFLRGLPPCTFVLTQLFVYLGCKWNHGHQLPENSLQKLTFCFTQVISPIWFKQCPLKATAVSS